MLPHDELFSSYFKLIFGCTSTSRNLHSTKTYSDDHVYKRYLLGLLVTTKSKYLVWLGIVTY